MEGGGETTYLVLEVDRGIEVRDLGVGRLDHHLALAGVDELAHLEDSGRRAHVALLETETAAACDFEVSLVFRAFVFGYAPNGEVPVAHLLHLLRVRRTHHRHRGPGALL